MRAMKTRTCFGLAILLISPAILHLGVQAAQPDSARAAIAAQTAGEPAGFPRDYATAMRRVSDTVYNEKSGLTTVFANDLAASAVVESSQHYPDGAVILMEFAQPQRDDKGELLRDERGTPVKGPIDHIDVMRRGPGLGAAYGADRAGEWEFASYRPDGSVRVAVDKAVQCAACHSKAGADKDFVFRTRPWLPH